MNEPWPIRPHHGLCMKHFAGKGYSREFVQRMTAVSIELKVNPSQKIMLHSETDLLCGACPHNLDGICETAQKVARYDKKCLELCGLHDGQTLSWQEFEQIVFTKIWQPERLCEICADCGWSDICLKITAKQGIDENNRG